MRDVVVLGVGMTRFGKFLEKSLKDLTREAVEEALQHAEVDKKQIEMAYVSNSMAGLITGQEAIRGQVWLRPMGIEGIPIFNVENACGGASTAFYLAWMSVAAGVSECVLAVGAEKLFDEDKLKSYNALSTAMDIEEVADLGNVLAKTGLGYEATEGIGVNRSIFMDFYSALGRYYMKERGAKPEHFGMLSVKSHRNGSLNPHAHYRKEVTLEEVMNSPVVSAPLTRLMCAPVSDGAAAAVLCSRRFARGHTHKPVYVAASANRSGRSDLPFGEVAIVKDLAAAAYEDAGIDPVDLDVVEVHDATTISEFSFMGDLGVCEPGEAAEWIERGWTALDGKVAFNTSGGLVSKGHPVGATGLGMIAEVVWQLRGEAGSRQVDNARLGLTLNGGGIIGTEPAFMSIIVLKK